LGLNIQHDPAKGETKIDQRLYIEEVLKKFGIDRKKCKRAYTPSTMVFFDQDDSTVDGIDPEAFRSFIM
jgi:hypothetical protein